MAETFDTNLLASNRRPRADAPTPEKPVDPAIEVKKSRIRRVLKIVAYVVVFLIALVFFTILKIPDNAVHDFVISKLNLTTAYRWQAQKVSLDFFPLPHVHFEALTFEPKFPVGNSQPINLEKLNVYPSIFGMIRGMAASFDAEAFGKWKGSFSQNAAGLDLVLHGESVDIAKLPFIQEMNWDIQGQVQGLDIAAYLPLAKVARADGEFKLVGKKLKIDPASFGTGMPLPILDFGSGDIQAKIKAGRVQIEKFHLGEAGKDVDFLGEGDIQLADNTDFSRVNLKVKLKLSDKIQKAVPTLDGMLSLMAAKKPDGVYAMKLSGQLSSLGVPVPDL